MTNTPLLHRISSLALLALALTGATRAVDCLGKDTIGLANTMSVSHLVPVLTPELPLIPRHLFQGLVIVNNRCTVIDKKELGDHTACGEYLEGSEVICETEYVVHSALSSFSHFNKLCAYPDPCRVKCTRSMD